MIKKRPELLAPAGNMKMIWAAINNGADAVYFGLESLNMRAKANNFSLENLDEIVKICHNNNVAAHLTINSIIYQNEIAELDRYLKKAKEAEIDMIICWDMAVISKCIEYKIPFCISTQASVSNSAAARFFKNLGAKRIVLARECTLENIIEIKQNVDIEIETFIHGAMCLAISGRCLLSHHAFGKSANRGECIQPCRREYEIIDKDDNYSLVLGNDYVLSPNDLCSIGFIDKLIDANIDSFKIEGRKRSPEYVAKVVSVYKESINLHLAGQLTEERKNEFENELQKVYNRGFSSGFYFGKPASDKYAKKYGSEATTRKEYSAKVINYFKKTNIAHIKIESKGIKSGEIIYIIGNTTGAIELKLPQLKKDDQFISEANKGDEVTFYCSNILKPGDEIYKIISLQPQ